MELSPLSRWLTTLVGILFALLGAVLFFLPNWAAPSFPWKVTPLVAMTMGGWYLGSAAYALETARRWRWSLTYPFLLFLWPFSLLESGLLLLHRSVLHLATPLGWPYVLTLAIAALVAVVGLVDRARRQPVMSSDTAAVPGGAHVAALAFVFFVSFLGVVGLSGRFGSGATIFPEPLTVLTVRAFGAFYLSLAISTLPLIWEQRIALWRLYARVALAPLVLVTLAALIHLDRFDFARRPGELLYIGAYLIVGIVTVIFLLAVRPAPKAETARSVV